MTLKTLIDECKMKVAVRKINDCWLFIYNQELLVYATILTKLLNYIESYWIIKIWFDLYLKIDQVTTLTKLFITIESSRLIKKIKYLGIWQLMNLQH